MNEYPLHHELMMQKALALAQKALQCDEVPVGALIVDAQGAIIGRGYNQVERRQCQVAHAEVIAIQKAAKHTNDWRLDNCWLFVTLQPCQMCIGLIRLSRLAGIVYGAASPLFGCDLDNEVHSPVYRRDVLKIVPGVCAEQSGQLLKDFFRKKRKKESG